MFTNQSSKKKKESLYSQNNKIDVCQFGFVEGEDLSKKNAEEAALLVKDFDSNRSDFNEEQKESSG